MAPIGPEGPIGPPGPIGPRQATIRFTVSTGTFTLTGEASVFQVQQHETQASYTLTGEASILTPAIVSAHGSFTETGEAALFQTQMLEAFGAFVETGEASIFTPAIVCEYGAFALTGEDAVLFEQPDVTDVTNDLQLPINCILAGQQLIRDRYRENTIFDPGIKATRKINGFSVQLDITGKFKKPSFTVTSNNRGYD